MVAHKAKHRAAAKRAAVKGGQERARSPMKLSAMEQDQADKNTQLIETLAGSIVAIEEINLPPSTPHQADWRAFLRVVEARTIDNLEAPLSVPSATPNGCATPTSDPPRGAVDDCPRHYPDARAQRLSAD
jgi:hypothetical protein